MCKQRCAFDRKDSESRKKLGNKLLCWLCTISMKRALAKAKQNDASIKHTSISSLQPSSSQDKNHHGRSGSKHHSRDPTNLLLNLGSNNNRDSAKRQRLDSKSDGKDFTSLQSDALGIRNSSSDHFNVVAMTQLKEQVLNLQKQIQKKDQELLEKDKKIAELSAVMKREEREFREKILSEQKKQLEKSESYQQKISQLQKQNATLAKLAKKSNSSKPQESPTDSPLL